LGERLLCKQEVIGSIPFTSTTGGAQRRRWCVGVAATVTGKARHESERAKDRAGRNDWWKHSVCLQCACIAGSVL
jgi:hypothetical protein